MCFHLQLPYSQYFSRLIFDPKHKTAQCHMVLSFQFLCSSCLCGESIFIAWLYIKEMTEFLYISWFQSVWTTVSWHVLWSKRSLLQSHNQDELITAQRCAAMMVCCVKWPRGPPLLPKELSENKSQLICVVNPPKSCCFNRPVFGLIVNKSCRVKWATL